MSAVDVLIGADSLLSRRSGVGRMTYEIVRAARRSPEVGRVHLLMAGRIVPGEDLETIGEPDGLEGTAALTWKARLVGLPGMAAVRYARQRVIDRRIKAFSHDGLVYYEPNMIARPLSLPTVVTINDLSWHHEPGWHPADRLAWIARGLAPTLRQARRITALSTFTKIAAVRELGVAEDRVAVVPLAPADAFRPQAPGAAAAALARFGLADRSYVLSVSTIEPRKNFDRLFAAHRCLPEALRRRVPLVIAGGKGWGSALGTGAVEAAIGSGELRMLGHVADGDLAALTARAAVFAYVSLYEGFGLPVIEAMAAGCAVVASGTTAIPEVAGDAAVLVDPLDEAAITAGLRRVLENEGLAAQLRAAGLARAALFNWDRTVAGLAACWRAARDGGVQHLRAAG